MSEWQKMENMPSPDAQRKASDEWRRLADMQCEFWRKVHRWMGRATVHEVITPEGYEWKDGEEVSIKYEDGKFKVVL